MIRAALTNITARPWRRHTNATVTAVRHVYLVPLALLGSAGLRGKNTRKSNRLLSSVSRRISSLRWQPYMTVKQNHCTPTCAIPKSPAAHSNVLTVLQHATSAREAGRTSMLANAHVPDVVPRRMKYGDMPSEVPRAMIL